ncbi:hypothetical protein [Kitasatospora sp. NPDC017646]|uniref:hypothetical protein n=1 Tax=Kitasatospora sp. NPDC017646 TaxID=3364024 RepID=UPI0037A76934
MTTPATQSPRASWNAQWECGACGDGGDALFEDGTLTDADPHPRPAAHPGARAVDAPTTSRGRPKGAAGQAQVVPEKAARTLDDERLVVLDVDCTRRPPTDSDRPFPPTAARITVLDPRGTLPTPTTGRCA